jgi:hypothetical protein
MTQLPKIVTERLRTTAAQRQAHPDPNIIAAFVEKTLREPEQEQVLDHLARCRDCREEVALSFPESVALPIARPQPAGSSWLSWPVLRWGAVAACIAIVGAAITLRYESRSSYHQPIAAQTTKNPVFGNLDEKRAQPAASDASSTEVANNISPNDTYLMSQPLSPKQALKKSANAKVAFKKLPDADAALEAKAIQPPAETVELEAAPVEPAAPASSATVDEMVPGRAKAVEQESPAAGSQGASIGGVITNRAATPMVFSKAAPTAAAFLPRWTLTSDGTLQRSLDSGKTWQTIPVTSQATFRALAANGMDIWVGGSSGALYHSADAGQHWTQVRPIVNGELLSADIIGVEFTDLLHGSVTTAAQETWLTDDAGHTWRKQ